MLLKEWTAYAKTKDSTKPVDEVTADLRSAVRNSKRADTQRNKKNVAQSTFLERHEKQIEECK